MAWTGVMMLTALNRFASDPVPLMNPVVANPASLAIQRAHATQRRNYRNRDVQAPPDPQVPPQTSHRVGVAHRGDVCTTMVLVVISVMGGWLRMFRESFHGLTGDVIVHGRSLTGFPYYDEIIQKIKALPEVQAAVPTLRTYGLININNSIRDAVQVYGYPEEIATVNDFTESLYRQHQKPSRKSARPRRGQAGRCCRDRVRQDQAQSQRVCAWDHRGRRRDRCAEGCRGQAGPPGPELEYRAWPTSRSWASTPTNPSTPKEQGDRTYSSWTIAHAGLAV
jgi:hypothetical protein